MKPTKYEYLHVVQGSYGFGWEDLTAETKKSEGRARLKEYRENQGGALRLIQRRVLREVAS